MKHTTNFPYHVLGKDNKNPDILSVEYKDNKYVGKLKVPDMILYNESMYDMLRNVALVAEINCSSTMFRMLEISDDVDEIIFEINVTDVYHSFSVDVIYIVNRDTEWHDQRLKKGMPVAHLGSYKIDMESRSQGLITFVTSDTEKIQYSFSSDCIHVKIPAEKFNWLNLHQHNPWVKTILKSQFAFLALIEACHRMKEGSHDHLLWQKELTNRWNNYSSDNKEFPDEGDIIPFVNKILNNPSDSLVDFLMINLRNDE